jgi:prepilin peptidase CpaA
LNLGAALSLGTLALACAAATWLDLTTRRIPNWLCGVTALLGLASAFVAGGAGAFGNHALHLAIALIAGMVLFRLGMIGGGDAKFYAAMASWFSLINAASLALMVALWGLVLLVVWFGYRRLRGLPVRKPGGTSFDSLPYGIAIAAGGMSTLLL